MRNVALKGMMARKVRLALTALSIALGVTLIAGTYVFTDTINGSFKAIFGSSYAQTDVAVTMDTSLSNDTEPPTMAGSVLDRVKKVDGVKAAEGAVFWPNLLARRADGTQLKGVGFNAVNSASSPEFSASDYVDGEAPRTADEVSILKATAEKEGLAVGDQLLMSSAKPAKRYVVSGIYTLDGIDSFGGGVIGTFTLAEAQRMSGLGSELTEVDVQAEDGVSARELRGRIADELKGIRGIQVRTGKDEAAAQLDSINTEFLGTLRIALLAFAGIALFVGAFLIFNTFSITVAQRTREFALLRVLGAKRRQVLRSVIVEGLVLGVIGSAAGLGLGVLTARLLRWLFKQVGADMPSTSTVIETRTVVVSLVVGIGVTLLASLAPALRATRIPPLAALRDGLARERGQSRVVFWLGAVLAVAGVVFMAFGLFGGLDAKPALSLLGLGAALTFLGVALLSPRLVGPLASVVGAPLARFGLPGVLARENSVRIPGRTAVTAAALMIGVALVTFASIFAAGASSTIRDAVKNSFTGQAMIQGGTSGGPPTPVPDAATKAVAKVEGVSAVAGTRFAQARIDGKVTSVAGIDTETFPAVYKIGWDEGSDATLDQLGDGRILISKDYADEHDLKVGSTLTLETQNVKSLKLKVVGITDDKTGLLGDLTVSLPVIERDFGARDDAFVMAAFDVPEDQQDAVRENIKVALNAQFQGLTVQSNDEFVKDQEKAVGQLLALIYALLAMAIVVSLFGIVNTLVLSISERVRELGLLRAIGMSRRQVRRMIRYEAVITALIGAVLGMALGVVLAVLVTRAIDDFALSFPIPTLIVLLFASAMAGVLAAVIPARRASRLDVLESLSYE